VKKSESKFVSIISPSTRVRPAEETLAMEIGGVGCVVRTKTRYESSISEAMVFVPGVRIVVEKDPNGRVIRRTITKDER